MKLFKLCIWLPIVLFALPFQANCQCTMNGQPINIFENGKWDYQSGVNKSEITITYEKVLCTNKGKSIEILPDGSWVNEGEDTNYEISNSQSVSSEENWQGPKFEYVIMVAQTRGAFGVKAKIYLQTGKIGYWEDTRVRDKITGKVQKFESVADALNYMGNQGWEVVNEFDYITTIIATFRFLMKRQVIEEKTD